MIYHCEIVRFLKFLDSDITVVLDKVGLLLCRGNANFPVPISVKAAVNRD